MALSSGTIVPDIRALVTATHAFAESKTVTKGKLGPCVVLVAAKRTLALLVKVTFPYMLVSRAQDVRLGCDSLQLAKEGDRIAGNWP